MALQRRRVVYVGRVQGVGFRATAARLAEGFDVSGFVRNLPDGSVEIEVQGLDHGIESFLEAVRTAMGPKIHSASQSPLSINADESPGDFFILD